jgi:hypothetical protein
MDSSKVNVASSTIAIRSTRNSFSACLLTWESNPLNCHKEVQAELHLTEELSLFASSQLGLQTAQPGPPDFNNTRIGQVKIGGQLYDALWNPISAGVLIHIGAGGSAPERGKTSETLPEIAPDIRAAAREIPLDKFAADPDLTAPGFKAPDGEPLMPELTTRIVDKW